MSPRGAMLGGANIAQLHSRITNTLRPDAEVFKIYTPPQSSRAKKPVIRDPTCSAALQGAIRVNERQLRGHIDWAVRSSVEESLNALLDAPADRLCGAQPRERSPAEADTRTGDYERKLETMAGEVKLRVPKLRNLLFETAIIKRYRRRAASVEEALVEMSLAGVSVRRAEEITEARWRARVSSGTVTGNEALSISMLAARLNHPAGATLCRAYS